MFNAVRMPSRGFIEYNTYIIWKHWEKNFGPTFQVQLLAPWLNSWLGCMMLRLFIAVLNVRKNELFVFASFNIFLFNPFFSYWIILYINTQLPFTLVVGCFSPAKCVFLMPTMVALR